MKMVRSVLPGDFEVDRLALARPLMGDGRDRKGVVFGEEPGDRKVPGTRKGRSEHLPQPPREGGHPKVLIGDPRYIVHAFIVAAPKAGHIGENP